MRLIGWALLYAFMAVMFLFGTGFGSTALQLLRNIFETTAVIK